MGIGKSVGEFLILIAFGGIIVALVRPNSQGPALVSAIGTATSSMVNAAGGGGSFNG